MSKYTLTALTQPESCAIDPLTDLLRSGARQLISQAVAAELQVLLDQHANKQLPDGRQAVVRNGHLPERTVQTGIGDVEVKVPKVRDRSGSGIRFNSNLLPPYLKRARSVEELLPWLYLKGISTGDFQESLAALLGDQAKGLSANTITRLKGKEALHDIWMAATRDEAYAAFDRAQTRFSAKYPKAMACLAKDRKEMLAFYDFPAEHWTHSRTTNPIESTFSTVRLRTKRTRNCGSRDTTLAMVYKLLESAQRNWKRIKGFNLLTLVVNNVEFKDGEQVTDQSDRNAA